MATKVTGLGRGLDSLIRETSTVVEKEESLHMLPLADIVPNPNQPRKHFEQESLDELASSISSQGVLQPLLVRPMKGADAGKYEIVAGERRWRASQLAGLSEVPVVVRSFSEQDVLLAALIENLQREDLNPIEEALGIETLRNEFALNQEELATQLGKSRSAIANSLRLLTLPLEIQTAVASGALSAGHGRALLGIEDEAARGVLKDKILQSGLSVREAEGLVSRWKTTGSFDELAVGNSPEPLKPSTSAKRKLPSSERLLAAQQQLSEALAVPVKVTGTENKGKISIAFSSQDELESVLAVVRGSVRP